MNNTSFVRLSFINAWRVAGWGSGLALLILPELGMLMTGKVNWTASDFAFAAVLLSFVGGVVELAVRFAPPGAPRVGYVLAGSIAFFTLWSNAAVGIIGDDNSINVCFSLMVVTAIVAGAFLRFRSAAMRWIALSLAFGQYAVGVAALIKMPGHAVEWVVLTFFAVLWLTAAWCFHRAVILRAAQSRID